MGTKVVTFTSYKGGSGRTSLIYNIISYFDSINEEAPIILVDFDIDSKGLTYLLASDDDLSECYNVFDLLNSNINLDTFMVKDSNIKSHPSYPKFLKIGDKFGKEPGAVLFLPVPKIDDDNNGKFDDIHNADIPVAELKSFSNKYNCPAVILDLPAGTQLTANIGFEKADVMVVAMKITRQFVSGTYELLNFFLSKDKTKIKYIIVPNAVPDFSHPDFDKDERQQLIHNTIIKAQKNNCDNTAEVSLKFIDEVFGIDEIVRLKYEEAILFRIPTERLSKEEKNAIQKYKMLVDEILS